MMPDLLLDPDIAEAMKGFDLNRPVAMLNQLKFWRVARYSAESREESCSGEQAYDRYARLVKPILADMGAEVILTGVVWFIGRPDEWDRCFVVKYRYAMDIITLPNNPNYQKIAHHRSAAIADSRLLLMDFDASGLR